jgi:hypothetical protein
MRAISLGGVPVQAAPPPTPEPDEAALLRAEVERLRQELQAKASPPGPDWYQIFYDNEPVSQPAPVEPLGPPSAPAWGMAFVHNWDDIIPSGVVTPIQGNPGGCSGQWGSYEVEPTAVTIANTAPNIVSSTVYQPPNYVGYSPYNLAAEARDRKRWERQQRYAYNGIARRTW